MARPSEYKRNTYLKDNKTNKLAVIIEVVRDCYSKSVYRVRYIDNNKKVVLGFLKVERRFTIDRTATVLYGK